MTEPPPAPQACHTCRRQRLKCNGERPHCAKCVRRGEECLGYGRLFRWKQGVASQGKMAGRTFRGVGGDRSSSSTLLLTPCYSSPGKHVPGTIRSPTDPLLQDLSSSEKGYMSYFATDVCRDFVLYDTPRHNPFRELLPLTHRHPVLLQIVVANSALHMSNVAQKALGRGSGSALSVVQHHNAALLAQHRALVLLQRLLPDLANVDVDIVLAVVLLFIEFELLDSGRDKWRHHVVGARSIIDTVCRSSISPQRPMSQLRSWLVSNCLVFDILGSTITSPSVLSSHETYREGAMSLLRDAEGNHCASFPAALLDLIRSGARLHQLSQSPSTQQHVFLQQQAHVLLRNAQAFDSHSWATSVQTRSPACDLQHRIHVASAHQAAVSIYLARILSAIAPSEHPAINLEAKVSDVVSNLSFIHPGDALFTATPWPTFIAGLETNEVATQEWVARRFGQLWSVEPWGLMRGAVGVLEKTWAARSDVMALDGERDTLQRFRTKDRRNWVDDLREEGVDWLIL